MAIAFVQAGSVATALAAGSMAMTLGSSITAANTLFVCITWDANDNPAVPSTIGDNLGNTYSLIKSFVNTIAGDGNLVAIAIYGTTITTGGSATVSVTMTGRGGGVCVEYSGITDTLDQFTNGQATTGTSVTTGTTGTTTVANELVLLVAASLGASSGGTYAATSYASRVQGGVAVAGRIAVLDQIVSSTGTFSAVVTGMPNGGFNGALLITLTSGGGPAVVVQTVFLLI